MRGPGSTAYLVVVALLSVLSAASLPSWAVQNCLNGIGPHNLDQDGDGAGDVCDCAPLDPLVLAPAETTLTLSALAGGGATLAWTTVAGADSYAVLRGDLAALDTNNYGSGLASDLAVTSLDDPDTLPPGAGHFYLGYGTSLECGEGLLGFDSDGAERSGGCP